MFNRNLKKDIDILYQRTDKRLKEAGLERQYRIKLQKRISKLETVIRKLTTEKKNKNESGVVTSMGSMG